MATGKIQIIDSTDKWYLADGLTEDDVAAAYQFIHRASWDEAKNNINTGTQYTLTGTNILYSSGSGLIIPADSSNGVAHAVDNSTLRGLSSIKAAIFGFSPLSNSTYSPGMYLSNSKWLGFYESPIINSSFAPYLGKRGVLGGNFSSTKLYFDGSLIAVSSGAGPYRNYYSIFGRCANDLGAQTGGICPALVLYNKELSDDQHAEIALNIIKHGWII